MGCNRVPTGSSSSLHIRSHRGDGDGGGGGDDDDDIGDLRSKPVFVLPPLQPCFPDGPNDVVLGRLRNSSSLDLRIRDLLFPFCSSLLFCLFAEIVRGWVIVGLKKRIHRNNNPRHGHTYSSFEKKDGDWQFLRCGRHGDRRRGLIRWSIRYQSVGWIPE